jgi:hypothetical protein
VGTSGSTSALEGQHGQRTQLAGLDMRQRRGQVVRHGIDLSAQRIGKGLARALVGNVQQLDARQIHEVLDVGMTQRSRAGRGEGVLAGVGLGQGDELLHGLGRHAGFTTNTLGTLITLVMGAKSLIAS